MRLLYSITFVLAGLVNSAQAGSVVETVDVYYYPQTITLGDYSRVTVVSPANSFWYTRALYHAPNGTSRVGIKTSNVYNINNPTKPFDPTDEDYLSIDPNTNQTCIHRKSNVTSTGATGAFRPESAGTGWGSSVIIDFYYSHDYTYVYQKNATTGMEMACIVAPYITERRSTGVHNITVQAATNGLTTTAYTTATADWSTATHPANALPEKWQLSPPGTGVTFDSGAERVEFAFWSLTAFAFFLIFTFVM